MNPLTLISAISTGIDLLSTAASLISGTGLTGASGVTGQTQNPAEQTFVGELLGNLQSSLQTTPQSSTGLLLANGAASLVQTQGQVQGQNGENVVSNETLEALNNILSGKVDAEDVNSLAESNVSDQGEINSGTGEGNIVPGGIVATPKLDDPFGIKAAEANGSPIAIPIAAPIPVMVPAQSQPIPNVTGIEGLDTTGITTDIKFNTVTPGVDTPDINNSGTNNTVPVNPTKTIEQTDALNIKLEKNVDKNKALNLAEQTDSDVTKNLANDLFGKDLKTAGNKTDPSSLISNTDKILDKNVANTNSAPNPVQAAFLAHDIDPSRMGDLARAAKSRGEISDKLSDIDTYKVVSVSKKDNVIDLRLEPAHLGKVQIKLDFTDGKTNVMVIADRQDTLDILQKDTKSIEKILTDNGIKADSNSLSFDLRGQQQQKNDGTNFFSGKALSFRTEEQVQGMVANDRMNSAGYNNYANAGENGLLNIMV